jgi:hypothetical protein
LFLKSNTSCFYEKLEQTNYTDCRIFYEGISTQDIKK